VTRARREFILGLRAVADFYQQNPAAYYDQMHLRLSMYVGGRQARPAMAAMARAFGHCQKTYEERHVTISRSFSEQVTLALFAPREKICRRVLIGEHIFPARIIPATKEVHIPARREPLVTWKCDPFL
jgi:hypothetical protein